MANTEAVVLEGGYVVTMDPQHKVLTDGSIGVVDGSILAIGDRDEVRAALPDARRVELSGALVLPGLIDGHHHPIFPALSSERDHLGRYPKVAMPGVWSHGGDIDALLPWAARPLGSPLDPDGAYLSALVSLASLTKSGVTCVVDGGTAYADQVAQAAHDLGVRLVVASQCQDLVPNDNHDRLVRAADADALLESTRSVLSRWAGAGEGRIRVAGSLFWPIGCSDELCAGMRELSERHTIPVLAHVAALANEPEASLRYHARTPFDRLDDLGLLSPLLVAAHAGFPTDDELARIAERDVRIAHVPATSTLGVHGIVSAGTMPRYVDAGIKIMLGTDGAGVRATEFMLSAAASFHKDVTRDESTLDAPTVLDMVTSGAARAIGWDDIGSLEVGKAADLVVVERRGLAWEPDVEPVGAFVSGAGAGNVSMVMVAGHLVVQEGRLAAIDEVDLAVRIRSLAASLLEDEADA